MSAFHLLVFAARRAFTMLMRAFHFLTFSAASIFTVSVFAQ
jgi:hypothetical protein